MAYIKGGTSTQLSDVGVPTTVTIGANVSMLTSIKPIAYGSGGHYRVNHRFVLVATQAANSRLFVIRNPSATNLIVPTRLIIKWFSVTAHTAQIEDSIDVYKLTGFTVLDTTNTVTLAGSLKRTGMGASTAQVRGVTVAGAAAGMTGGTSVKDSSSIGQMPRFLNQTVFPTTGTTPPDVFREDIFDDVNGTHPFVFALNEGIVIENRVLLGAAAGSSVYIDFSWAEVTGY